jgi:hypothetical protein
VVEGTKAQEEEFSSFFASFFASRRVFVTLEKRLDRHYV